MRIPTIERVKKHYIELLIKTMDEIEENRDEVRGLVLENQEHFIRMFLEDLNHLG
jgi:cyclopropane fatty-acyl-phospholipid synthase-like methyltransferase